MIEYDNEFICGEVICDSCGYSETYDGDFSDVVKQAKKDGWAIVKYDNNFEHYCKDCKEEFKDE